VACAQNDDGGRGIGHQDFLDGGKSFDIARKKFDIKERISQAVFPMLAWVLRIEP
jgi:hypothetical protein